MTSSGRAGDAGGALGGAPGEPSVAATPAPRPRLLVLGRIVAGYTWRLLRELERVGVEVRAVHRDSPERLASQFAHEPGPASDLRVLSSDQASWGELVRFMEAEAADAIVALGSSGNLTLLLLAHRLKRRGVPLYLFTDANVPAGLGAPRDWARHVLYRALRPLVREAWTLGASNEAALHAFGVHAQRRLPMYAVDFAALGARGPLVPHPGGDGRRRIRLVCVARLSPEKNLLSLCAALDDEAVAERFELLLVGGGPQRAAVERAARRSRAEIRLAGAVSREQMHEVFARADALVLPSRWEPWGIAVVEALGLGLPVLATTRVGSATSLAERGGVVLSAGTDPASLRRGLVTLADRFDELRAAAGAAAEGVREEYGVEAIARRVAEAVGAVRTSGPASPGDPARRRT